MRDKGLKYGYSILLIHCEMARYLTYSFSRFNMNILDDARSFPSLWKVTQRFLDENPAELHPNSSLEWILQDSPTSASLRKHFEGGPVWKEKDYNGCQFFSNFES